MQIIEQGACHRDNSTNLIISASYASHQADGQDRQHGKMPILQFEHGKMPDRAGLSTDKAPLISTGIQAVLLDLAV